MITKLDIMLDPEAYDGSYVGDVKKAVVTDNSVQFSVDFDFNGKPEQILATVSLERGLNRTVKMLRENGIKKIDELKNVKKIGFVISDGWVNITSLGDGVEGSSCPRKEGEGSDDSSRFFK